MYTRGTKSMNKNVHRNICNSPKLEATQMSSGRKMDKQIRVIIIQWNSTQQRK